MKKNKSIIIVAVIISISGAIFIFNMFKNKEIPRNTGIYDDFAQCLYNSGLRMYGSATCSFCAKQKKLFGSSAPLLQEIECDPRNDGAETERCIAKEISHTPTWILEDKEGNDLTRFDAGLQSLATLSEVSECPIPNKTIDKL